jgi:hypothetical protein
MGQTETDRRIEGKPWSSAREPKNTTSRDTLRSERKSALKKDLTEPMLSEMFGNLGEFNGSRQR